MIKPGYDPRLTNEDLAPLGKQTWTSYNIFAFWMSDVHSVGGYVTAGSLFALGLASWQVLIALLVGIIDRLLPLQPGRQAQPAGRRAVPGDLPQRRSACSGANIPAIIRGLIAVAWYGIQTYLASAALDIVLLKLFPGLAPYADVDAVRLRRPVAARLGQLHAAVGRCRRRCSGAAWSRSASSSTSAVPPSTS